MIRYLGVIDIAVSLMGGKAEVKYDAAKVLPSQIANVITELGFDCDVMDEQPKSGEVIIQVIASNEFSNFVSILLRLF